MLPVCVLEVFWALERLHLVIHCHVAELEGNTVPAFHTVACLPCMRAC